MISVAVGESKVQIFPALGIAAELGSDDCVELRGGAVGIVVDDDIIIEIRLAVFAPGTGKAAVDLILGVGIAAAKTLLQRLEAGRNDKHLDGLRHLHPHRGW